MADRSRLISIFRDTIAQYENNERLKERTKALLEGSVLCPEDHAVGKTREKAKEPVIVLSADTTYSAARKEADGKRKVAVLNFANAYTPGGGVTRGSMAQEESLCRSSNLYASLTLPQFMKDYYNWNRIYTDELGTSAVIVSPGVTVFKSDDLYPEPQEPWFDVDVLTCAAPHIHEGSELIVSEKKLRDVFYRRNRNIINVARAFDEDVLILGAFGCGAFHNPPELVADTYRQLLVTEGYGKYFEKVIFAIKPNYIRNTNLEAFQRVFREYC